MLRRHLLSLTALAAIAIWFTWPLLPNLQRAVAYPGDPYLNTWILDWDWWATFHRPLSLFQAPMFFPARFALAFSENLYGIAVVLFPLRALGAAPLTTYNMAILGGFVFSGFAAYLLALELTGAVLPAFAAGLFYAFVPYRFTQIGHVQYVWGGTVPLLLYALVRYRRRPTWATAAMLGAAFLWNGLSNIHFLLFGSVALVVAVAVLRPPLVKLGVALAAAGCLLLPFLLPYRAASTLYGMQRTADEAMSHSAEAGDWLLDNGMHRLYPTRSDAGVDAERWLFPGAVALLLACAAPLSRRWHAVALGASWALLGFIGSLGLRTPFYRALFDFVPGFRAIRVPARFANIAYVGLAMLIAVAAAHLSQRRRWVGAVIAIALVIDLQANVRWYMAPTNVRAVDEWAASARPPAILELPFTEQDAEYEVLLRATAHHRPIVNGVSGFAPPEYRRLVALARDWSPELMPELRRIGVSHLIVRGNAADAPMKRWLGAMLDRGDIGFVQRFADTSGSGDWLFRVGARADSPEVRAMLAGRNTYNAATFGALTSPISRAAKGPVTFRGVAISPYGVKAVNLLFNAGAIRIPAVTKPEPSISRSVPWYDATTRPSFELTIPSRPRGVHIHTDVQVEIIDGRGGRTLLDDRWLDWY